MTPSRSPLSRRLILTGGATAATTILAAPALVGRALAQGLAPTPRCAAGPTIISRERPWFSASAAAVSG